MLPLILGLVVFLGIHLLPTAPGLRSGLAKRFGEGAFKAVFAVVAALGLVLIVVGYHKLQLEPAKNPQIWMPPVWTRHVNFLLMLGALILLVAAYVPSRIRTAAKHPMLAAVKLWALGHLLANGDLGSMLMFGSFLAWAVFDRISVKRRGALGPLGTAKASSNLNDVAVVVIGAGLWLFMLLWGHAHIIGVPLLPGWT
jgi:uncharacterized membrane protein